LGQDTIAMKPSRIQLLQAMPIFGGIKDDVLAFLVEQTTSVTVPQGRFFFREGERGEAMYVLEEGEVAVVKSWEGRGYVLKRMSRGDSFGEMALVDLCPRSASVKATRDTRALELDGELLLKLYEHDMEQFTLIQMNVAREISRRLRVADERIFRAKMDVTVLGGEDHAYTF
jgi:CRP-like cAMP-binding protein